MSDETALQDFAEVENDAAKEAPDTNTQEPEGGEKKKLALVIPVEIDAEMREVASLLDKGISEIWTDAAQNFLERLKSPAVASTNKNALLRPVVRN